MKLVRDKIPELIRKDGMEPKTRIASEKEYQQLIINKLQEETEEYVKSQNLEELADILEVIMTIAEQNGSNISKINSMREEKKRTKGAFNKRIILE